MSKLHQQASVSRAAHDAIAAFRGAGKGGTVEQLLADRRADAKREPASTLRATVAAKPKKA